MGVPKRLLPTMVPLRLSACFVLLLVSIPTLTKGAPTQQAVNDFIASEVEYIQDFFDSISSFFLGDSAQQAEREDEEYDYEEDNDNDYRDEEEEEGAESRSSEVDSAPRLKVGSESETPQSSSFEIFPPSVSFIRSELSLFFFVN